MKTAFNVTRRKAGKTLTSPPAYCAVTTLVKMFHMELLYNYYLHFLHFYYIFIGVLLFQVLTCSV